MSSASGFSISNKYMEDNDFSSDSSILAKLKRLKIDEGLLISNLNKFNVKDALDESVSNVSLNSKNLELTESLAFLRESYKEIKNVFEDIKSNTNPEKRLEDADIADVKRDVLLLENKIKWLKLYLQSELQSLINSESKIVKNINENPVEIEKIKRYPKLHIKTYNDIVPSPVKNIINNPFRCPEVQQFQEFIKNSQNRYGGWNEYSHNIFVRCWEKYFSESSNNDYEAAGFKNTELHELFSQEVLKKIQGIRMNDVTSHMNWYLKYLYLRKQQNIALDKWKKNKRRIKSSTYNSKDKQITAKRSVESCRGRICRNKFNNKTNNFIDNSINNFDEFQEIQEILTASHNTSYNLEQSFDDLSKLNLQKPDDKVVNNLKSIRTSTTRRTRQTKENHKKTKEALENCSDLLTRFNLPTKQWNNRCNSEKDSLQLEKINIHQISKLRIPVWRLGL